MGYFDDLPCMGKTFETFCTSLELLMQLEKYNLKARVEKCYPQMLESFLDSMDIL